MPSNPNSAVAEHRRNVKTILTYEFLKTKRIVENKTAKEIALETGFDVVTVKNRIKCLNVPPRGSRRARLNGRRFGMLLVLDVPPLCQNGDQAWLCRCDCGNETRVLFGNLVRGGSKSCGCVRHRTGDKSLCWKGHNELSGRYWAIVRNNAKKRGLTFNIDIEQAWQLFLNQERKCAFTGWDISLNSRDQTASLDRIDSSKGYEPDNIQWVHKRLQYMKMDLPDKDFIETCIAVARNRNECDS